MPLMPMRFGGGTKAPGMNWSDQTKRGQDFTRCAAAGSYENAGHKVPGFRFDGSGRSFQSASVNGIKGSVGYLRDHPNVLGWAKPATSSHSSARKAASAMIAKIPLPLSQHIAATFLPRGVGA